MSSFVFSIVTFAERDGKINTEVPRNKRKEQETASELIPMSYDAIHGT